MKSFYAEGTGELVHMNGDMREVGEEWDGGEDKEGCE